jgi:hypothetical protein
METIVKLISSKTGLVILLIGAILLGLYIAWQIQVHGFEKKIIDLQKTVDKQDSVIVDLTRDLDNMSFELKTVKKGLLVLTAHEKVRLLPPLTITKEEIDKNISDPDNLYGRCVYRCDNDIVDNQIVNMQFEDGIVAQLKSLAFSNDLTSVLKVYGTEGILSNLDEKTLKVEKLNGETTEYEVEELEGGYAHHAGGDVGIVKQYIEYLETGKAGKNITDIEDSVMGHEVGFLAEESRKQNGKLLFLSNNL